MKNQYHERNFVMILDRFIGFLECVEMASGDSETIRDRILSIVDGPYAGSQRALALAIGFDPSSLSRVLAGHVPASKKLLQAIAQLPQVNEQWLSTGEGEPIQTKPQVLTDIGAIVPVAKQLLPGQPLEFEHFLSHRFLSVPRAFCTATTYAIDVQSCKCDQELRARELLKPGDTLIVETSPDRLRDVFTGDSKKLLVMCSSEYGAALAGSESDYYRITEGLPQSKQKMDIPTTIDGRKGRAIKLDEYDENNLDVPLQKMDLPITTDGRKGRAIILDEDVKNYLDEPVKRGTAQRTGGRKESPVVVGLVTLLMREYLQS